MLYRIAVRVMFSNRLSDLKTKYPNLIGQIDYFADRDPSKNQKYLDWEIRVLESGKALKKEIADVADLFHKHRAKLQHKDINQYVNFTGLRDELFKLENKGTRKEQRDVAKAGTHEIFRNENVLVLRVDNRRAAREYGKGTKWCITMEDVGYFDEYVATHSVFYYILGMDDKICVQLSRANDKLTYWASDDDTIEEDEVANFVGDDWPRIKSSMVSDAASLEKNWQLRMIRDEIEEDELTKIRDEIDLDEAMEIGWEELSMTMPPRLKEVLIQKIVQNKDVHNAINMAIREIHEPGEEKAQRTFSPVKGRFDPRLQQVVEQNGRIYDIHLFFNSLRENVGRIGIPFDRESLIDTVWSRFGESGVPIYLDVLSMTGNTPEFMQKLLDMTIHSLKHANASLDFTVPIEPIMGMVDDFLDDFSSKDMDPRRDELMSAMETYMETYKKRHLKEQLTGHVRSSK